MKRFSIAYFLLSIVLLTLSSCSTDSSSSNQNEFLKRIVDVSTDGSSKTSLLNYDGNKIVSVIGEDQTIHFTYTNDLITEIITTDIITEHQTILDYTYTNGELAEIVSSENYVMDFIHNTDGTVSYEKKTTDADENEVLVFHGKLYFNNGNLLKDERTFDDTGATTIVSKREVTYQYDAKSNPFSNVTGFSKLLDYFQNISVNNAIKGTETDSTIDLENDQSISSFHPFATDYKYNAAGYPTEMISEKPIFGNSTTDYAKSLFYYE